MAAIRRYFESIANPEGAEDSACCIHTREWAYTSGWAKRQCSRKRGHGPGGMYCWQHARLLKQRQSDNEAADAAGGE